jgi:UDP-N-acetylenolpyruvoylglucosamine reductase
VNRGHASANDIIQLAALIVEAVQERFGIKIEPEVNYI